MKISKISRDVSRDFENYIFGKFLSNVYSQYSSFARELFSLTLKTTFLFFFFENFSSPRINRTTRPTAFYRSSKFCRRYRGSIMRKPARIYESNIRRTHSQTAHCRRNKAFRTVALLYWSNSLSFSLSLSLCFFCSPFFLIKLHTPFYRAVGRGKRKRKNGTREVIHHHHHHPLSGIYIL